MIRNPRILGDLYVSSVRALDQLEKDGDLSSHLDTSRLLAKAYLLCCASFYEETVTRIVSRVVHSGQLASSVVSWLERVAVSDQFYKWFDFRNAKNAKRFLGTFGEEFTKQVTALLDKRDARRVGESSFLLLCVKRNECVHQNFAAYDLQLSLSDIHAAHRRAMCFLRAIEYSVDKWLMPARSRQAIDSEGDRPR